MAVYLVLFILANLWLASTTAHNFDDRKDQTISQARGTNKIHRDEVGVLNLSNCKPVENVFLLKTRKTAGTTLATIFQKFGYSRNLSFFFNNYDIGGTFHQEKIDSKEARYHSCFPLGVNRLKYLFDMGCVHMRLNMQVLKQVMARNTKYVTIIREPAIQLESAFYFYRIDKKIRRFSTKLTALDEFLENPWKYSNGHRIHDILRNRQIYDLGLERRNFDNVLAVKAKIARLHSELDLVLLADYFDESLILLKNLLCWNLQDLLYFTKNKRLFHSKLTDWTRDKIHEYQQADLLLYQHFNRTFWEKVKELGPKFWDEVQEFRLRRQNMVERCQLEKSLTRDNLVVEPDSRKETLKICQQLSMSYNTYFNKIKNRQMGCLPYNMIDIIKPYLKTQYFLLITVCFLCLSSIVIKFHKHFFPFKSLLSLMAKA